MKVCIVGAGAIGGFIGTRIAARGEAEVSAIARGATLEALREHGWRLRMNGELVQAPARVSENPAELGVQDIVIIAVKGPALETIAKTISSIVGDSTTVVPAMNGVPWWFVEDIQGIDRSALQSVDPRGTIASAIPSKHVIGAVVHAAALRISPGLVEHKMGHRIVVGEPRGGLSDRAEMVASLLNDAGFDATTSGAIHNDIWYKLWGNVTMNPISAITGATADRILADPLVREFCSNAMRETAEIGKRIGILIKETPEQRHVVTAKLGAFKTSMLQDTEAGSPIELDSMVGAVREIGMRLNVQTPNIDILYGLTRLFGDGRGLYSSNKDPAD